MSWGLIRLCVFVEFDVSDRKINDRIRRGGRREKGDAPGIVPSPMICKLDKAVRLPNSTGIDAGTAGVVNSLYTTHSHSQRPVSHVQTHTEREIKGEEG